MAKDCPECGHQEDFRYYNMGRALPRKVLSQKGVRSIKVFPHREWGLHRQRGSQARLSKCGPHKGGILNKFGNDAWYSYQPLGRPLSTKRPQMTGTHSNQRLLFLNASAKNFVTIRIINREHTGGCIFNISHRRSEAYTLTMRRASHLL